ncbi:hypothetical protein HDU91_007157 [Kappamyces sp. JEL0680]|nr:hypothetical protein HDU91_007157 [Kappamyces sp. JEL0680]
MSEFLLQMCDLHLNYVGCPTEIKQNLATVDTIVIAVYCFTFLLYLSFVGRKVVDYFKNHRKLGIEVSHVLYPIFILFPGLFMMMTLHGLTRATALETGWTLESAFDKMQTIVFLEMAVCVVNPLAYGLFALGKPDALMPGSVQALTGDSLYVPIKIHGDRVLNPSNILKIVRVVSPLLIITSFSLLGTLGLTDIVYYERFRSFAYLVFATLGGFVSAPLFCFFGYRRLGEITRAFFGAKQVGRYISELQNVLKNTLRISIVGYVLSVVHFGSIVLFYFAVPPGSYLPWFKLIMELFWWVAHTLPVILLFYAMETARKQTQHHFEQSQMNSLTFDKRMDMQHTQTQ